MAQVKVQIVKRQHFHGIDQTFGNTYTFEGPAIESDLQVLIAAIANSEKNIHSTDVTFLKGYAWEDNAILANHMLADVTLSGTGLQTPASSFFREAAILCSAPLPHSFAGSRRNKRFLRKFYRCGTGHGRDATGRTAAAAPTSGTPLFNFLTDLTNSFSASYDLVAPNGDLPTGSWTVSPFLFARNLGK